MKRFLTIASLFLMFSSCRTTPQNGLKGEENPVYSDIQPMAEGQPLPDIQPVPNVQMTPGEWKSDLLEGVNMRTYVATTPPRFGKGRALMINLHGCAQQNIDLQVYGNWEGVADYYGMIVALPQVPGTNVFMPYGSYENRFSGCWGYYGTNHTTDEGHTGHVLSIVDKLLANESLNIDPSQIYVVGFSSGGALAVTLGCLRPDIFAGIGSNSGPALGSLEADLVVLNSFNPPPFKSAKDVKDTCLSLANGRPGFDTQLASFIHDQGDMFVNAKHTEANIAGLLDLYQLTEKVNFSLKAAEGINSVGAGVYYADSRGPRISRIANAGMNHAWAAGTLNSNMQWISLASVNYPRYVTDYFFRYNRRLQPAAE